MVASLLPGQAAQAGLEWKSVSPAIPRPPAQNAVWLSDVAALSPSDVWTVGGWYANDMPQTLTAHWDGKEWTVVPIAVNAFPTHTLEAVDSVSSNDVWAAGYETTWDGSSSSAYVAHFDGTAWSAVPAPPPGSSTVSTFLVDLDVVLANEGWAVGHSSGEVEEPLVLHWYNGQWTQAALPTLSADSRLRSVHARSGTDVWAAGSKGLDALIMHWDGSGWTEVSIPHVGPIEAANELQAITTLSTTEVWAVGKSSSGWAIPRLTSATRMSCACRTRLGRCCTPPGMAARR